MRVKRAGALSVLVSAVAVAVDLGSSYLGSSISGGGMGPPPFDLTIGSWYLYFSYGSRAITFLVSVVGVVAFGY